MRVVNLDLDMILLLENRSIWGQNAVGSGRIG